MYGLCTLGCASPDSGRYRVCFWPRPPALSGNSSVSSSEPHRKYNFCLTDSRKTAKNVFIDTYLSLPSTFYLGKTNLKSVSYHKQIPSHTF